ncbi:MAG: FAD-dependent oxidoreductase [Nitrosomonas sp.]|nr:FAD-dependent oxidoreductase [Nitrosomonas sp.]
MKALSPCKKHLCLIGGGHSHVTVIKQWIKKPIADTRVTLVSPDIYTPYSGMLPGLIAGHYSFEDCHINLQRLCNWAGVQFLSSTVEMINPDLKTIHCTQIRPVKYDLLSINIGSRPAIDDIQGADSFGSTIKPVKDFLNQWSEWLSTHSESKHKQRIVVVGGGAAGVEVLLAMYYRLQSTTSINAAFTLICADQTILPSHNPAVQNFFLHYLQSLNITIIRNSHVTAINRHQLHLQDETSIQYDFTVWAIHAGAHPWPAKSSLKCNAHGFIEVDRFLRSTSHQDIFAAGDSVSFMPRSLPKAGVFAVREGPVLFKNLIATLQHQPLVPFRPQQNFLSLLTTGDRYAVASRGAIFFQGKWVWHWKNHIDQAFMRQFKP